MKSTSKKNLEQENKAEISKEAIDILKQTVAQINNFNSKQKTQEYNSEIFKMSSNEIARSLSRYIDPSKFTNTSD